MKGYRLQIVCETEDERIELRRLLSIAKGVTGYKYGKAVIKILKKQLGVDVKC